MYKIPNVGGSMTRVEENSSIRLPETDLGTRSGQANECGPSDVWFRSLQLGQSLREQGVKGSKGSYLVTYESSCVSSAQQRR